MITLAMGAEVRSSPGEVWSALVDPDQIQRWRPGVERLLGQSGAFPEPDARLRWRCRLKGLPITLEERAREVRLQERLHTELKLGLFRFEETFSLLADSSGERTRLALKIRTGSEMALVGESLDRFAVRRFAADLAAVNLQAIRDWCERGKPAELALPDLPGVAAGG